MKFYNYLNEKLKEDMTIDEINEMIHKDCRYYLNITKGIYMFKRGMYPSVPFGLKKVRQDRKPRATDKEIFPLFNKWLEENNHVRRDKAVIAANTPGISNAFGNSYYIFPIGKFNYTWIKANDVNVTDRSTGWDPTSLLEYFKYGYTDALPGKFEGYFVTNSALKTAWAQEYETWFDCKEYYYFSAYDFKWNAKKKELI